MKRLLLLTSALIFSASLARAAITADDLVSSYQSAGYSSIEVVTGVTQVKIEAVKDGVRVEVIYDIATGDILKEEQRRARAGDTTSDAVEVSTSAEDFVGEGAGEDDGHHRRGRGQDDGADDHGGHGRDDGDGHDAGDDHGGNHGGSHDDDDDDSSGSSSGDDDDED